MPNEYTPEPCPVCDGTGNLDDVDGEANGRPCGNCGGTGRTRPVHIDPKPTIAPGALRRRAPCDGLDGDDVDAPSPCLTCSDPECDFSTRNIDRQRPPEDD